MTSSDPTPAKNSAGDEAPRPAPGSVPLSKLYRHMSMADRKACSTALNELLTTMARFHENRPDWMDEFAAGLEEQSQSLREVDREEAADQANGRPPAQGRK